MEGNEIKREDQEGLNSEWNQAWNQEWWQDEAKKVFTFEEVEAMKKAMQSDSDKWVQKILWEQKLYKQSIKELGKLSENPDRLIELADENPRLAEIILEEYFEWESLDEYKDRIWYKEDYSDPKLIAKKIEKEAKILAEKTHIDTQKTIFIDKLKMEDEEKEAFEEAFEELRCLKSFSSNNLEKQFEKAYRLSNESEESLKKLKNQEIIWRTLAVWENKTASSWDRKKKEENPFDSIFKKFKTN